MGNRITIANTKIGQVMLNILDGTAALARMFCAAQDNPPKSLSHLLSVVENEKCRLRTAKPEKNG